MLKSWMFKSFRFSLFDWALAATAFYCGAVFSGVHENWTTFLGLRPNEVGDFLAGVFGPLAFLWLVFGYYQQGEELKHSVKALKLQAEELRNSVEQQREMVRTTSDTLRYQVEKDEQTSTPDIHLRFDSLNHDFIRKIKIQAINTKGVALNFSISSSYCDISPEMVTIIMPGEIYDFFLALDDVVSATGAIQISIEYENYKGNSQSKHYSLEDQTDPALTHLYDHDFQLKPIED